MIDSSRTPDNGTSTSPPRTQPAPLSKDEERLSDPDYIRSQEYKKRIYERHEPSKTMNTKDNVVLLPDGSAQATGPSQSSQQEPITMLDAAKTIRPEDFTELARQPCVRQSLLNAIGGGVMVGGARKVLGASVIKSANWAVGTFVALAFGLHEYCQFNRMKEKDGVKRAVEIMREKAEERRDAAKAARLQRKKEEEEQARLLEEQKKRYWGLGRFKFW